MNNDANPFTGCGPIGSAGQEDLGGDFNLAGAAGRAARIGSVFEVAITEQRRRRSHRRGLDGAAADPTGPPLPEKEEAGEGEPEGPSTELLRRVLAGNREPDTSRVKLAKIASSDGILRIAGEGLARLV